MAQQTIIAEIISAFLSKINSNFNELYAQSTPDADRAFSHTYIAKGDEVATPTLVIDTPTKYQLPITAKSLVNFEIAEVLPGIFALQYTGLRDITCSLNASTSVITGANNVNVTFMMYKNGAEELGAIVARKVGTGADLGSIPLATSFTASTGDYFDVYVMSDVATTITFLYASIVINEVHQD